MPDNHKQLSRLKQSELARWRKVMTSEIIDTGSVDSAFCSFFLDSDCEGCPVHMATTYTLCRETPYADWVRHHNQHHLNMGPHFKVEPDCIMCQYHATKVMEYLRELKLKGNRQMKLL